MGASLERGEGRLQGAAGCSGDRQGQGPERRSDPGLEGRQPGPVQRLPGIASRQPSRGISVECSLGSM